MTYRIKVTLPGIKGFHRIYEIGGKMSLYQLHRQMNADMDFPPDQVVLFKALDYAGNVIGRYATFNLGDGSIENINMDFLVKKDVTQIVYFYDTIYKRSVNLTIEGEGSLSIDAPTLIDSKGPNPEAFLNGFVAMEDLPEEKRKRLENPEDEDFDDEDEDFDMDGEEDQDEDGAELYGTDE